MATRNNNNNATGGAADWPLIAADHSIGDNEAQVLIAAHSPPGLGGYFTPATINSLITPANAGIRYYFTIHNGVLTVMLVGVQRISSGVYNDIVTGVLAVSDDLTVVHPGTNQRISLNEAETCNRNYRNSTDYDDGVKGGMFGIDAINSIIALPNYSGIRFYFGNTGTQKTIVLYGVDGSGHNLLGYIADRNCPCPTFCSNNNQLNT